jgi:carbon storage regulator CsrA
MEGPVATNDIMEESTMLVLSRKVGESIFINESIRVTVVGSRNGQIRLGIEAPPEVRVLREELTKSCFYKITHDYDRMGDKLETIEEIPSKSSPSKNGKAEALSPSAQLP